MNTPLFGTDAAWWKMNNATNRVIITALLRFGQRVEATTLVALLEQGIAPYPQFRRRIVARGRLWQHPVFEDAPNFRVADHVRVYPIDAPVRFEELEEIVGALMSEPLPDARPLWQATLIDEADGGSALVFRVHHAVGDGAALVHFLLSLAEEGTDAPTHTRRNSARAWYAPLRFAAEVVVTPFALLFKRPEGKNPFRGELGTEKRAAWSQPLPLERIKAIGKATGSTVNDVLVAAVAGALRPFLAGAGIGEARAAIPVALRAFGETPELGNRIGIVLLDLPVGEGSTEARLATLKARMNRLKQSPQAHFTFFVLWLVGYLPAWVARLLAWFLGTKITAVMTNVPGPRQPLTLAGAPIAQMMFWVPQAGNCGLGVSVLSYNDTVTVGITTDAGLFPHPEEIVAAFEAALAELEGKSSEQK